MTDRVKLGLGLLLALWLGVVGSSAAQAQAPESERSISSEAVAPPPRLEAQPLELPSSFLPVLTASYIAAPLLALVGAAYFKAGALAFFAVPVLVHAAYGDWGGGLIALLGYPATVLGVALIGFAIERPSCDDELFCGFGGFFIGGLVGMVAWPIIDVALIAPRTWHAAHRRNSTVGLRVKPGSASLIWAGRF